MRVTIGLRCGPGGRFGHGGRRVAEQEGGQDPILLVADDDVSLITLDDDATTLEFR